MCISPGGHISHAGLGYRAIAHSLNKFAAPEAGRRRHSHVQTAKGRSDTGMLGTPVGDDEALEPKLSLEKAVQGLAVGRGVRVVDSIVRAHNIAGTGMNRILEWPFKSTPARW